MYVIQYQVIVHSHLSKTYYTSVTRTTYFVRRAAELLGLNAPCERDKLLTVAAARAVQYTEHHHVRFLLHSYDCHKG